MQFETDDNKFLRGQINYILHTNDGSIGLDERKQIAHYLTDLDQSKVTEQTNINYNKLFAFIKREDKEKKSLLRKITKSI